VEEHPGVANITDHPAGIARLHGLQGPPESRFLFLRNTGRIPVGKKMGLAFLEKFPPERILFFREKSGAVVGFQGGGTFCGRAIG
jgi:hypothetical protein